MILQAVPAGYLHTICFSGFLMSTPQPLILPSLSTFCCHSKHTLLPSISAPLKNYFTAYPMDRAPQFSHIKRIRVLKVPKFTGPISSFVGLNTLIATQEYGPFHDPILFIRLASLKNISVPILHGADKTYYTVLYQFQNFVLCRVYFYR